MKVRGAFRFSDNPWCRTLDASFAPRRRGRVTTRRRHGRATTLVEEPLIRDEDVSGGVYAVGRGREPRRRLQHDVVTAATFGGPLLVVAGDGEPVPGDRLDRPRAAQTRAEHRADAAAALPRALRDGRGLFRNMACLARDDLATRTQIFRD